MIAPSMVYGALRTPPAAGIAATLPDVADSLSAQLHRLSVAPDADDAAAVAANLEGARRAVLRLREALMREVPNGVSV